MVANKAPNIKVLCIIAPIFCRNKSLKHSACIDANVAYTESERPQQSKPNEAIHRFCEKIRISDPSNTIKFAILQAVLLPRLSARIDIAKLPTRLPKKAALE